jgi:hypothetical protein
MFGNDPFQRSLCTVARETIQNLAVEICLTEQHYRLELRRSANCGTVSPTIINLAAFQIHLPIYCESKNVELQFGTIYRSRNPQEYQHYRRVGNQCIVQIVLSNNS